VDGLIAGNDDARTERGQGGDSQLLTINERVQAEISMMRPF
jgi:hypothetical protein